VIGRRLSSEGDGERGQQHQREHGEEVLDDQPSHRDAPVGGIEQPAVFQCSEQHHGARDRETEPEDDAGAPGPAPQPREQGAEEGSRRDLHGRARQRDPADRQQVVEGEVDPHTEHQQDHADLGELLGQLHVGDESR
jgi:hypothetical protein